ncbi:hypothetical protein ACLOJK_014993, partial [Asimina triloba]
MLIRVAIDGCCDERVLDLPMGWPTLAIGIKESGFGVAGQAAGSPEKGRCCRLDGSPEKGRCCRLDGSPADGYGRPWKLHGEMVEHHIMVLRW